MVTVLIYEYAGVPVVWKLATMVVAAVCFARLMQARTETAWKRHFVYWLMTVLIINSFMDAINFPLPLFRLYILLATLTGLFLFWRWAPKSGGAKGSGFYTWLLRLASFFFAFMVIAQIWGRTALPLQIFVSLIDSTATVLVFMLLMSIIHGILEWLYRASPLHQAMRFGDEDTDAVIRHTVKAMYFAIWTFVLLPAIFMIWGFYNDLEEATQGILSLGFNIGSQRISIGLLIVALAILYGSYFASSIIERLLMKGLLIRRSLEMGVRHAIARLVHYFLIFMAFLLAISALGFDITKLTIMLSALGVGIGFGLQTIVNNFVSGLILLFERPVRVGDTVEFGGNWANIKKIGLRATTVETFDNADVIIPNADLVGNQVTNWTLTSRQVRLIVPVGVAYGSDVPLVIEKLMSCARSNPLVVEKPAPQVLFLGFGESSLDFELRAWVTNFDNRLRVISELHQEIDRSFRKAKIEIAFPQRDLHLRSVDESVSLTQTGNSDYR